MFGLDDLMLAAFVEAAPEMFATEAATATAAEIAAAETTAAAQALATQQAAAAATAAQQATQAGIMEVGGATSGGSAAPLLPLETVQVAGQGVTEAVAGQGIPQVAGQGVPQVAGQGVPQVAGQGVSNSSGRVTDEMLRAGTNSSIPSGVTNEMLSTGLTPPAPPNPSGITSASLKSPLPTPEPQSALMKGLNLAVDWAKTNPFPAMTGAYLGANALGLLNPSGNTFNQDKYSGPLSKYKLSPDFKGSTANPEDFQYKPRYAMGGGIMGGDSSDNNPIGYDEGGVSEYAKGGSLSDSIESYQRMLQGKQQAAPATSSDVGIYHDSDPDTRYQDAFTAAQIRQAKVNKRANMQMPGMQRPTPMGQLNLTPPGTKAAAASSSLDPENAARGGIMHSSLGGYADGGNPRLLSGPGDGMSDNIPATISGRQPARLADGEFVVPADVVSHLGNGSTEAGAKRLHSMMDEVRSARTGNKKQGKQIVASKYMPK